MARRSSLEGGELHGSAGLYPSSVLRSTVVALGAFDDELMLKGGGFNGEPVLGSGGPGSGAADPATRSLDPTRRSSAVADPAWAQRIRR